MYRKPVLKTQRHVRVKLDEDERGPERKMKSGVQFVPKYCTYKCFVSSTSLVFDFGCSFSLVTAKERRKRQGSVIDLNTDSFYLLVSPGQGTSVGSSRRSPQTPRGVRGDGGEGADGGGWGGWCWRTPPLGDSVSCHWAPAEGTANTSASKNMSNGTI